MNRTGKQSLSYPFRPERLYPWLTSKSWQMRLQELLPDRTEAAVDGLERSAELAKLEGVLFLADEPLELKQLAKRTGIDSKRVLMLLKELESKLQRDGSSFVLSTIAGGYQLRVPPEFSPWIQRILGADPETPLSQSATEVLAIIAYHQPIMRAKVEAIRGVGCGEFIAQLLERGLIRITGRDDSLGRPVLYGTTKKFLQLYGLNSLEELK